MNLKSERRPAFPKRAIITAGMPYGNKELHFGHIGGVFIHADIFARFLRDRIGDENVIFLSGTDCYGNTIEVGYQNAVSKGFSGSIKDYVEEKHKSQKETLIKYQISLNLFAASALGDAGTIHADLSSKIFNRLYEKEKLRLDKTLQFYDEEKGMFLNGRQVIGRCPIQGCKSEIAYADECALGHQYNPTDLINPISTISGKRPILRAVKNWFFDLPSFSAIIQEHVNSWKKDPRYRKCLIQGMEEFFRKPALFVKKELIPEIYKLDSFPHYTITEEENKNSWPLFFENLNERDKAKQVLDSKNIRYRSGKAVVPFRISGNVNWGIPVPDTKQTSKLSFWVWPESLWAPISFTKCFLGDKTNGTQWERWWKSDEAQVFQFIGEDNIYFYGLAELGILMALETGICLPIIIPNHHLLFGKAKASSSGEFVPPKADDLLNYYTSDQLRLHFMNASLSDHSVRFEPRMALGLNDKFDPVTMEGNLITNILNRIVRSCLYTVQKYCDGVYPQGNIGSNTKEKADQIIIAYEKLMAEFAFDKIFETLNVYLREVNKEWSCRSKNATKNEIEQLLRDMFHIVRVSVVLFHPIVPAGCDMIREYLGVDKRIWNWDYIFEPLDFFINSNHKFKFLKPHVDFFCKHPLQTSSK